MKISLILSTISPDQEKIVTFCKKDHIVEGFKIYTFQTVSIHYQPKKFHIKGIIVKIVKIAKYDPTSTILRHHFGYRYSHKTLYGLQGGQDLGYSANGHCF